MNKFYKLKLQTKFLEKQVKEFLYVHNLWNFINSYIL